MFLQHVVSYGVRRQSRSRAIFGYGNNCFQRKSSISSSYSYYDVLHRWLNWNILWVLWNQLKCSRWAPLGKPPPPLWQIELNHLSSAPFWTPSQLDKVQDTTLNLSPTACFVTQENKNKSKAPFTSDPHSTHSNSVIDITYCLPLL